MRRPCRRRFRRAVALSLHCGFVECQGSRASRRPLTASCNGPWSIPATTPATEMVPPHAWGAASADNACCLAGIRVADILWATGGPPNGAVDKVPALGRGNEQFQVRPLAAAKL